MQGIEAVTASDSSKQKGVQSLAAGAEGCKGEAHGWRIVEGLVKGASGGISVTEHIFWVQR